jgi:PhnB protein
MAQKVAPVPKGYRTATPCLIVNGVEAAIDFYTYAFDATTLSTICDPTESFVIHANIKIGNSIIVLQQESAEIGILSPVTLGNNGSQVHLYVEDVDFLWTSAVESGAIAIAEPMDTYWGDRTGTLLDPFGHRWSLASRVEHVSREESRKRAAALYDPEEEVVESNQEMAA